MKLDLNIKKKRNWPKLLAVLAVTAIIVIITSVVISRQIYYSNLRPLDSSSQKTIVVEIPVGYSLQEVADKLKELKVIRSDWAFTQYVRDKHASNDLKAGTYELSPGQSVAEIVAIITGGKISSNLITILPGQRLDQIRKMFANNGYSQADIDKALDPNTYKNHPALVDKPVDASLEGYLYPESFQKTSTTKPEVIVKQSLDEMQKRLTPSLRAEFVSRGLTVHQGIILASIIEKEADKQADREKVAQVFYKRIANGMALESDATAIYGAALANQPLSVTYDSDYNTYSHKGLPPGPISNVSESSLHSVARPASTSYLFFVAGDDGTVHFTNTREEHEAKVRQYCKKQCAPH